MSLSPAGREVYVNMVSEEQFHNDYRDAILRGAGEAGVVDRPVFEQLAVNQDALDYDTAKALKKALFLGDWIEEVRTKDIERRYQVWAGALRRVRGVRLAGGGPGRGGSGLRLARASVRGVGGAV